MKKQNFFFLSIAVLNIISCSGNKDESTLPRFEPIKVPPKEWTFDTAPIWADEFEKNGAPDPTKWSYDIGGSGWGNNELEYYTDSRNNSNVADGKLIITTLKENYGGRNYTSARMATRGKGDFLYGRFEIKAKLPAGKGTWPAIWMLPTDFAYGDWPKSGEIDIMEHVGYDPNVIHITTHTLAYYFKINTQKTAIKTIPTATTDFHIYRIDWTPLAIKGYIDDSKVFEFDNENTGFQVWPFDKRFHILLNLAYGGDWGGAQGIDDTALPQKMEVDYVRVYKMIEK